jgi:short-chain fatty acids transporter
MKDRDSSKREAIASEGRLARTGLALAAWSERWFPDPAVVAFLGVVVVFVLGVVVGEDPGRMAFEGGKGFWALLPFTMQMVMIIVGGHVVASTAVARSAIRWACRVAGYPAQRGCVGRAVFDADLFDLLGFEPDLQDSPPIAHKCG